MSETVDIGQVAYEGYCAVSDGKSLVTGETLPTWAEQTPERRAAWRAAADAVLMFTSTRSSSLAAGLVAGPEVTVESDATAASRLDTDQYRDVRKGHR